jgi:prepilin-type N-terminal cleavage/methylation domain-containing protein
MIMKKPGPLCRRLAGLTLIELLAVIAIVGLLMALLLPSLQGAREAARRLQCGNHLKQMAGGIFSHESALGYFPDGGDRYSARRVWIGAGNDKSPGMAPNQSWGWAYQILPFIEMQSLWGRTGDENLLRATTIGLYTCPTRRGPMVTRSHPANPGKQAGLATIDYAGNGGTDHGYEIYWPGNPNYKTWKPLTPGFVICQNPFVSGWSVGEDSCPDWGMPGCGRDAAIIRQPTGGMRESNSGIPERIASGARNGSPMTYEKLRDGASNTMLLGEKCMNVGLLGISQTDDDLGWNEGWDWDTIRWGFVPPMADYNDPDPTMAHKGYPTFRQAFGSSHPGGFMIVLCDGSVRSVSYNVAQDVFRRLSSRDDAEVLNVDDL